MILVSTACNNVSTLCIIDNVNGNVSDIRSLNGTSTSVTGTVYVLIHTLNLAIFCFTVHHDHVYGHVWVLL